MENFASTQHPGLTRRATVRGIVHIQGIGLHSGDEVNLWIKPAPAGTGLVFQNKNHKSTIAVSPFNAIDTRQAVTLSNHRWRIQTVEHLLAALAATGVSDAMMELDSQEVPILDGSAKIFFEEINRVGVRDLGADIAPIRLTSPVWVVDGDRYLVALPSETFKVTCTIDFPHPELRGQTITMDLDSQTFSQEILSARTFGFLKDVEALRAKGLIKGASAENAIVLTEDGYLNREDLRFADECIRHKVLDLVGDLYLMGRPLLAHVIACRGGHGLDVAIAKLILQRAAHDELSVRRSSRPLAAAI
ncbi:MAG: UDP-3-O-acyl-N-acetylglucosamine deacetylase [Spirochaetia bacterium]|nr:UDP-3-O-acyl-N-acetylglucosamine deacetylase [Spirochaetia bacterium]